MPKKKSELWNLKFLTKETETRKKFHRVSNNRSLKAHCKPWCIARREHKSQFSCYRKLLIVVKGSLSSYFKAIYHLFVFFVYVCKYAPDYLYSIYTCDLSLLRCRTDSPSFSVHQPFEQIGYPFEQPRLSVQKNCHPFERLGLPLRTVRTACQLRYCSKTISPEQFATNLSENVHNSSKRCLPSPHVLSRYIFYSIHLFFLYQSIIVTGFIQNWVSRTSHVLAFLYANIKRFW